VAKLIDERAGQLMKALVESYITYGQPVGSKALLKYSGMNLSSATIRHVMADLEKMGLIHSPHTSAGRIPTVPGYRLFVDNLLSIQQPDQKTINQIKHEIIEADMPHQLLEKASATLSGITQMAGLIVLPRKALVSLVQIEFLPLSENRVLAILVQSDDEVQNRVIQLEKSLTASQLQQMSNYLNQLLKGKSIKQVCKILLSELDHTRERMDEIMRSAIKMATHAFTENKESRDDFMITGETNLMQYADMADMERMRHLFDAFHEKRHILSLINQVIDAEGVKLFIGNESEYEPLDNCSVVAAPYKFAGQTMGVLGVIGPTRMAYERVIPIVDITAKLLTSALNHGN
jgi:heat-inducible transcriptional repressor